MTDRPDILLVGTGALACLFAARLSEHAEVSMLGSWAQGLEALQKNGVSLVSAEGVQTEHPVRTASAPAECEGVQFAIVLVKSWQTERAARQLEECLAAGGVALTLQNGLGNLEILQAALGRDRVTLGVTTTGATLEGPGRVRAGGSGPTHVGEHPRLDSWLEIMRKSGFEVHTVQDLDALVWRKLAINAAINPLTALLEVPNGAMLESESARTLMGAAAREVAAVARAKGVDVEPEATVALVEDVARRTATNRSSMLQDIQRGAPTEIDAIAGAVVREGERHRVETPVNQVLMHLVHAKVTITSGDSE